MAWTETKQYSREYELSMRIDDDLEVLLMYISCNFDVDAVPVEHRYAVAPEWFLKDLLDRLHPWSKGVKTTYELNRDTMFAGKVFGIELYRKLPNVEASQTKLKVFWN